MTGPGLIGAGETRTTCPYCGVGCGLVARRAPAGHIEIKGDPAHPANRGRICSKGATLADTLGLEGRLLHPEMHGRRVSWDTALDRVAESFADAIATHGPDSVAFYVSGQLLTEDYYVANKLMKGFIGSANIDTNSRLCMASSVAGHKRAFGEDIVPGNYEDIELADLIVVTGSNLAWCHPVLYQRMTEREAGMAAPRVVVIDPRKTETASAADLHLPVAPGTDAVLFNGLLAHLESAGAVDRDYVEISTRGFDAALAAARASAPDIETVARHCGLQISAVRQFFDWFTDIDLTVTLYSQGVHQSRTGADNVNAIINCHLATGRIGRPGMGPFSLTGQPNAMGGREVGGLANQLAAHADFEDPGAREAIRRFWRAPSIAGRPGLNAVELFEAVHRGDIKALWIMSTNPAVSLPDSHRVRAALAACPFVAVSDCVRRTDTNEFADVLLPAQAWGEKDGTVTNSERRISRQRGFVPAPGEARPDWWIVAEVAKRMGFGGAFDYADPAGIFREHAALSAETAGPARLFDISNLAEIDEDVYRALNPIQWPLAKGAGASRLLGGGTFPTADGRARFVAIEPRAAVERDPARPLLLNTGRLRDQWHTMTRSGRSPRLMARSPEPTIDMHAEDAARAGVGDGSLARIANDRGTLIARVRVTETQTPGTVFAPIHWSGQFADNAVVGSLIAPVCDPVSGQPELKQTPVSVRPLEIGWHGFALTRSPVDIEGAAWCSRSRAVNHVRTEFTRADAPGDWNLWARAVLGELNGSGEWLSFGDRGRGRFRFAVVRDGLLTGCLFVAPDRMLPDREWLSDLFAQAPLQAVNRMALLAGAPVEAASGGGPVVCTCLGISRGAIEAAIAAAPGKSAAAIGHDTGAGTVCGSCRAELAQLVARAGEVTTSAYAETSARST